jgi:hypothetical protein
MIWIKRKPKSCWGSFCRLFDCMDSTK